MARQKEKATKTTEAVKTTEVKVDTSSNELEKAHKALKIALDHSAALEASNEILRNELKEAQKGSGSGKDSVVLDGKRCKIVLRETARELSRCVGRSEVDEDATVLVLDVYNG